METEQMIQLMKTVSSSNLTGFFYEEGQVKLKIEKKQVKSLPDAEQQKPVSENRPEPVVIHQENKEEQQICAPLVGVFYAAPSEDAEAFVQVGDTIKKGQTLAIIEAMKLMNEIESEYDGVITEILVKNGQAVEYGQPLFCVREK